MVATPRLACPLSVCPSASYVHCMARGMHCMLCKSCVNHEHCARVRRLSMHCAHALLGMAREALSKTILRGTTSTRFCAWVTLWHAHGVPYTWLQMPGLWWRGLTVACVGGVGAMPHGCMPHGCMCDTRMEQRHHCTHAATYHRSCMSPPYPVGVHGEGCRAINHTGLLNTAAMTLLRQLRVAATHQITQRHAIGAGGLREAPGLALLGTSRGRRCANVQIQRQR